MDDLLPPLVGFSIFGLMALAGYWGNKRFGCENDPTGYSGMSLAPVVLFFPISLLLLSGDYAIRTGYSKYLQTVSKKRVLFFSETRKQIRFQKGLAANWKDNEIN